MTWMQAHSGRPVDLLTPKPSQIYMGDIAHALARLCRYTGHTTGDIPLSVAAHSVHVYRIVRHVSPDDSAAQLWGLLHDAHEAYVGDIATPLQEALGLRKPGSPLAAITDRLDRIIAASVGISAAELEAVRPIVKRADMLALAGERAAYMAPCDRPWNSAIPAPIAAVPPLKPMRTQAAERLFVKTFAEAAAFHRHAVGAARRPKKRAA